MKKGFNELIDTFNCDLNDICEDIISNGRNSKDDRYELTDCLTRLLNLDSQIYWFREFYNDCGFDDDLRYSMNRIVNEVLQKVGVLIKRLDFFIDDFGDEDTEIELLEVCAKISAGIPSVNWNK